MALRNTTSQSRQRLIFYVVSLKLPKRVLKDMFRRPRRRPNDPSSNLRLVRIPDSPESPFFWTMLQSETSILITQASTCERQMDHLGPRIEILDVQTAPNAYWPYGLPTVWKPRLLDWIGGRVNVRLCTCAAPRISNFAKASLFILQRAPGPHTSC
ncbi:hypothetical protein BDV96DRAFT_561189 [Lophiotrema nucula]|uniref:Uncharacterized protein n=1 Tax=Lophiotrema nucula TaxID=690887 RepID=A0A6A5ZTT8_9PLEO|nr:hypothetical protein BDV96DRAFT_561189 [Lophiotrema nucula]